MKETFAPTVVIDETTITPPSWMWIFAFAIKGIPWAVEETTKPEFQETVRQYLKDQHNYKVNKIIEFHLERIEELRKGLYE